MVTDASLPLSAETIEICHIHMKIELFWTVNRVLIQTVQASKIHYYKAVKCI